MSHYRNLHIGTDKYRYNIGQKFVAIRGPKGSLNPTKEAVGTEVTLLNEDEEPYTEIMCTPKDVKNYIEKELY